MIEPSELEIDTELAFFANKQKISYKFQIEKVEEEINKQLINNPNDTTLLLIWGQIQNKYHNNIPSALSTFKRVLELDPQNIDSRLEIINTIQSKIKTRVNDCQQLLDECFILDESYWRVHFLQGMQYNIQENPLKASEFLKKANLQFPNNPYIMVLLAQVLMIISQNNKSESSRLITTALQYSPFNFELYTGMGIVKILQKELNESRIFFEKALLLNKSSSVVLGFLSQIQSHHFTDFEKSIELGKKSLEINPQNLNTLMGLSYAFFSLNKYDESITFLKKAAEYALNKSTIYQRIATLYFIKGDALDECQYYCQKIRKTQPNNFYANLQLIDIFKDQSCKKTIIQFLDDAEILDLSLLNSNIQKLNLRFLAQISTHLNSIYEKREAIDNNQDDFEAI